METTSHCDSKDRNITTSCYTSPFIINLRSEGQHYIYTKIKKCLLYQMIVVESTLKDVSRLHERDYLRGSGG